MILFTILAIIIAIMVLFTVAVVGVAGGVGLILTSDIIVCIGLVCFIVYLLFFRKKKH